MQVGGLCCFWRGDGQGQPGVPDTVIGRKDVRIMSSWAAYSYQTVAAATNTQA
jgi:hypothetical protein